MKFPPVGCNNKLRWFLPTGGGLAIVILPKSHSKQIWASVNNKHTSQAVRNEKVRAVLKYNRGITEQTFCALVYRGAVIIYRAAKRSKLEGFEKVDSNILGARKLSKEGNRTIWGHLDT